MGYLIAKAINADGCIALKVTQGKSLVEFKRMLDDKFGYEAIEFTTISRPSAYPEYEPYNFVYSKDEFINNVERMYKDNLFTRISSSLDECGPVFSIEAITEIVKTISAKYNIESVYLFGSYARGEATADSDLDLLVFGEKSFKKTLIFALAEELHETFKIPVDVLGIEEIDPDSDFYKRIKNEMIRIV